MILLATLCAGCSDALMAQTDYDYVVVTYEALAKTMVVSYNGDSIEQVRVPPSEGLGKAWLGANPALKEVNRLEDEGWELFDTGMLGSINAFVFYLRREEE